MTARGRPARRDATEKAIVAALRKCGVFVVYVSGDGCPDLLCRLHNGGWLPLEVKGAKTKVSAKQSEAGYRIVRSVSEALQVVGIAGY